MKKLLFLITMAGTILLQSCSNEKKELQQLDFGIDTPHQINILFSVKDYKSGQGIPNLSVEDFKILEDGDEISSEAGATIKPLSHIDIHVNTILLIDNSKSMEKDIPKLKKAAKSLVDEKADYQSFAIYQFSSSIEMLHDFTNNKDVLHEAIDKIGVGSSSTNFYGAIQHIGNNVPWENESNFRRIRLTNLICLSDGHDTQGVLPFNAAQEALTGKSAYFIGYGEEMQENILKRLGKFYELSSIKRLKKMFLEIQNQINNDANSYYWLYYQSPKRGEFDRTLSILSKNIKSNRIDIQFNSGSFRD